ncbi:hypothetical protein [Caenimonas aquaedulcis]|uniref:Lasso RiPP family leader peptide-containing protein n=1 Tax=Caenimonas aquaedulcis TaxID=2793270 RepID=A0A931H5Z0_9BURK|nr:hypothetical protein [Caenimonas aquaedulcis]MBG9389082.1 hypothetical protein [Caenimonas aquaedulcis]
MNSDSNAMDPRSGGQAHADSGGAASRKPYHAPVLLVYGDIRTLTQSLNTGNADGMGGAAMQSTHL